MKKRIKGVFAPITTPFVNEEVAIEQLRENMRNSGENLKGDLAIYIDRDRSALSYNTMCPPYPWHYRGFLATTNAAT